MFQHLCSTDKNEQKRKGKKINKERNKEIKKVSNPETLKGTKASKLSRKTNTKKKLLTN